jgi:hypothetical protein
MSSKHSNPSFGKVIEKQLILDLYVFLHLYEYYGKKKKTAFTIKVL